MIKAVQIMFTLVSTTLLLRSPYRLSELLFPIIPPIFDYSGRGVPEKVLSSSMLRRCLNFKINSWRFAIKNVESQKWVPILFSHLVKFFFVGMSRLIQNFLMLRNYRLDLLNCFCNKIFSMNLYLNFFSHSW